jgi:hypothetical protein
MTQQTIAAVRDLTSDTGALPIFGDRAEAELALSAALRVSDGRVHLSLREQS